MWSITALDLDHWSGTPAARTALPALVRRLVHAVATPRQIDFPAFEGVDAPGWDGSLTLDDTASPWTPAGRSFWEISCRLDIGRKAASDLQKRTEQTPLDIRRAATFVFVTARRWPGRAAWEAAARAANDWGDVRAISAETLTQWLETAPAAALWIHSQLGRGIDDLCAPDDLWELWAGATQPKLTFDIFAEAYEESRTALQAFFGTPPQHALPVAADTRGEAAAFAVGALMFGGAAAAGQNCVVVRTEAGLQRLRRESALPIVVIADRRLETALGDLPQRTWVLIAADRASLEGEPNVGVRPLTWEAYYRTVQALRLSRDQAAALDEESGRRVTIMRRRLSSIPQVRRPLWADMPDLTPSLAGLALAGGWFWETTGDREILSAITGQDESQLELAIQRLAMLEDAPIFTVANAGGLISRHDAFPALRHALTRGLAGRFYEACRAVFSAPDPALDLAPDQRWMANIYGKDRPHSGRLRGQLAASLAFLSNAKKGVIDGFAPQQAAESLIADLFAADDGAWLRLRDVLPDLAETAPRAFLEAATRSLPREAEDGGLWKLIKPTDNAGFGGSPRVQLIWALERLGADPRYLAQVAEILAGLCARPLEDNLVTKPHASLVAMLHPEKAEDPSTAQLQGRVLKGLALRNAGVAWSVALALIDNRLGGGLVLQSAATIGAAGHTRPDGPVDAREVAFEIALGRCLNAQEVLGLVEKSACFDGAQLVRLWERITEWQGAATEPDRAAAREAVRRSALWRDRRRSKGFQVSEDRRARQIFELLQAPGPAGQYAWLFQSRHVQHGSDELWDEKLDWRERERRIEAGRKQAVETLWAEGGLDALVAFARGVGSPETVGVAASQVLSEIDIAAVADLIGDAPDWSGRHDFVMGVIGGWGPARRSQLEQLQARWAERREAFLEVLLLCPADAETWAHVDHLPAELQADYWQRLTRRAWDAPQDAARACREFLKAGRPRAALNQTLDAVGRLDSALLIDVLTAVAEMAGPEQDGLVDPHAIEEILVALDGRPDADRTTRLRLDFIYVQALKHSERGIAALSEELAANPEVFALAIRSYFRRNDGSEEPVADDQVAASQQAASHWMHVLESCRLAPGAAPDGVLEAGNLQDWLEAAATLLETDGRRDRGFYKIGVLLSRLRRESDGVWPPMDVAAVLEPYANESFCSGLEIGILNSRGVHSRGRQAGGAPERILAEKYRAWRRRLETECPNLARAFEAVASSYDRNAQRHDDESKFERLAVR